MKILLRAVAGVALALATMVASAAPTFQIEAIYSNADGAVQYVVLHETSGLDGQQAFTGGTLRVTRGSDTKTFTFPTDLPSGATANRRVLVASQSLAALGFIAPDYVFPDQFLSTSGATLTLFDSDQVVYGLLPADGVNGVGRTGVPAANVATNFAGASKSLPPVAVTVIEYYDAARDHYFMSSLQPDIDALDRHIIPGWTRTGKSFGAYATAESAGAGAQPVCRFYIPPENGDSHFFSASIAECAAILNLMQTNPAYAGYVYETAAAFYIGLPDLTTGACPIATLDVFRLWNQRIDSNHRYTDDPLIKAAMIALGFAPEGYGPLAVAMCAPDPGPVDLSEASLNGIAWTGTIFVVVGGSPTGGGLIAVSPDGFHWSVRSSGTPTLNGVTWTGSQLVAVGAQGAIVTSPDGYRWTAQASNATETLNAVAAGDALLMAVGDAGALLSSPDGVAWTRKNSKTTENLNGAAWNGTRFIFVGDNGAILTMLPNGAPSKPDSGTAVNLAAVAVGFSGRIIAVGSDGTILISSDASNWSPRTSNTNASLQAVAAVGAATGDIQFVAVARSGRIVTSTNGNTWTVALSRTSANLAGVAWSGVLYVAVGATGTIDTSTDGTLWTVEH